MGPEARALSVWDVGLGRWEGTSGWAPHALTCCSDTGEGKEILCELLESATSWIFMEERATLLPVKEQGWQVTGLTAMGYQGQASHVSVPTGHNTHWG